MAGNPGETGLGHLQALHKNASGAAAAAATFPRAISPGLASKRLALECGVELAGDGIHPALGLLGVKPLQHFVPGPIGRKGLGDGTGAEVEPLQARLQPQQHSRFHQLSFLPRN